MPSEFIDVIEDLGHALTHEAICRGSLRLLQGIYEHSPWIAQRAATARPFVSLEALKGALCQVVRDASRDEQLGLIRAHPELAGKAMVRNALTEIGRAHV